MIVNDGLFGHAGIDSRRVLESSPALASTSSKASTCAFGFDDPLSTGITSGRGCIVPADHYIDLFRNGSDATTTYSYL